MIDGSLKFDTKLDASNFNKALTSISNSVKRLKSVFFSLGITIGGAFTIKQAITFASDLEEVQNVVDVAFGDMSYKMEEFAKTAIESFGMSQLSAKQTGSTFMAMAKGMNFASEKAADMALSLTALSADMASFYNISQEEAKTALSSIYTGETETLKRYGILITEVNLQEYARQQGITKSISAMTQQEKVMLRYNYVMNATKQAQGDFARTSDSWANQTKILTERFKELLTVIGQGLIQILTPALKILNQLLGYLINIATTANSIISSIFGGQTKQIKQTSSAVSDMAIGLSNSADNAESLGNNIEKAGKQAKGALASFDELNIISQPQEQSFSDTSLGGLNSGTSALTPITDEVISDKQEEKIKEIPAILVPVLEALGRLKESLEPFKNFLAQGAIDFYNLFLKPLGVWTMTEALPRFIDALVNMNKKIKWNKLNKALANFWDSLEPFAENVGEGLLWLWENVLVPLGTWTISSVLPEFLNSTSGAIDVINGMIETAKPMLEWIWDGFLLPIAQWTGGVIVDILNGIGDALNWISQNELAKDVLLGIATALATYKAILIALEIAQKAATLAQTAFNIAMNANPIMLVVTAIGALIGVIIYLIKNWDKVKETAINVWNTIKEVWSIVANWFNEKVINPVANFFKGMWDGIKSTAKGCWDGIKSAFSNAWSWFDENVIQPIWEGIKWLINSPIELIEGFVNICIKGINFIINALNKIHFEAPDWDWLPNSVQGKSFGININPVKEIKLPRLATGTVVPANYGEFQAILGDNKREPEIVSPLSTMIEAFETALNQHDFGGNSQGNVYLDGEKIGRILYKTMQNEKNRRGTPAISIL